MRIRTVLVSAVLVTTAMVLGLALASWTTSARLNDISQLQQRAVASTQEVSALLALTHEYALHGEERAAQQWKTHQALIVRMLEQGSGNVEPVVSGALLEARQLAETFRRLEEVGANKSALRVRQTNLLFSQLLSNTQDLGVSVRLWTRQAEQKRQEAEQQFHVLAIVFPAAMLLALLSLSALLYHRVLHPLAALHRAVRAVAQGDLSVRSATKAKDEFGDLSRTFDAMAVDMVQQLRQEIELRREAEQALTKANSDLAGREAFLRQILDTSSVAIFLADTRGCIVQANRRMAEMFGLPLVALCGKAYVELLAATDQASGQKNVMALVDSEIPSVDLERRYLRADGSEFWGYVTGKRFVGADGVTQGFVAVIVDISDQKQASARLRNIKAIVDSSDDAIVSKTLDGIINSWNEGARRIFGYTAEEAIGHPMQMLIPPDRAGEEPHILARISRGERVEHFETLRRQKDGRLIDVSVTISPVRDESGKIVGASNIARDITEHKQAEAQLAQYKDHLERLVEERTAALSVAKEVAETANRAKSAFLANMSHELRTPMNGIMGMTELAMRRATDPRQSKQLATVGQSARRLLAIINDILDISKLEAEHLSLEQVDFKLSSVLANLSDLNAQPATEKGLMLMVDLAPALANLALRGDAQRLGQILINLTDNAIKFTPQGYITVSVKVAGESANDILLRFEVMDTGIGISAPDQRRLFTAFEQADSSTTRKFGGAGLGLALSKRLAMAMGGEIGVESQEGQGSTFWFTARLGKRPMNEAAPRTLAKNDQAGERIKATHAGARLLVAENEPINQEILRELLEDIGLQMDIAEDGGQAVEAVRQRPYDLILMDMHMPNMGGLNAARQIRNSPNGAQVPILAMTSSASIEDKPRCIAAGMNDFIAKPVEPDSLFATLEKWLSATRN